MVEHLAELCAEKRRYDGWRRLVGSQTVGVRRAHDARLEQSVVTVDSHQRVDDEGDEAQVFLSRLSRSHEGGAVVSPERPVVVLSGAVYALEGLFVEQHSEAVGARHLAHERHYEHVVVHRQIALLVYRGKLKLVRCHLVVACLHRYSQFESLYLEVFHERGDTYRDGSEVMILELLVLRRLMTHERASGEKQVRARRIESLVHQKILLLPSEIGKHLLN